MEHIKLECLPQDFTDASTFLTPATPMKQVLCSVDIEHWLQFDKQLPFVPRDFIAIEFFESVDRFSRAIGWWPPEPLSMNTTALHGKSASA